MTTAWSLRPPSVIPGFGLTLGVTLAYLGLIVLLPLAALVARTFGLSAAELWAIATTPRVIAAFRVSFGTALIAAVINVFFGLLVAWVLVRYRFPGHRLVDAMVDLPFALPTAVAGIALTALYAPNGWVGRLLDPLGIKVAYTPLSASSSRPPFILPSSSCPHRSQAAGPEVEHEEAAASLGAGWQTFTRVTSSAILRPSSPGSRRLARGVGEYGSLIFHCRQHAGGLGDRPAPDREQARAVRLCGRHGPGGDDAAGLLPPPAHHQPVPALDALAPWLTSPRPSAPSRRSSSPRSRSRR
jgi:sulfate transport system permease protein